jgi:deoxyhypusine synthase
MTDINKYKNVSLPKDTYNKIDSIMRVIVPQMTISRSQTITLLVNEKEKSLNGKLKQTRKKRKKE